MLLTRAYENYFEYELYILGKSMLGFSDSETCVWVKVHGLYQGLETRFHNFSSKFVAGTIGFYYLDDEGHKIKFEVKNGRNKKSSTL